MGLFDVDLNQVKGGKVKRSDKIEPLLGLNYRGVLDAATNVPVVGDVLSGGLAAYDLSQGDYGSAALNAVSVLPFLSAGMIKKAGKVADAVNAPKLTEFEQRHLIAQKNAALPIEQGGLGLPPNNTAMDRARAMGAVDFTHGTTADVPAFDLKYYGSDGVAYSTPAVFGTTDAKLSSDYAFNKFDREISDAMRNLESHKRANPGIYDDTYEQLRSDVSRSFKSVAASGRPEAGGGANVMPLVAIGKFKDVDANGARFMQVIPENLSSAKSEGFDGVRFQNVIDNASPETNYPSNVYAVFNPANIRSRFAAFDPMRRHEADLLGYADPRLLGAIAGGGLLGLGGYSLLDQ